MASDVAIGSWVRPPAALDGSLLTLDVRILTTLCLLEPLVGVSWQYAFGLAHGELPTLSEQVVLFAALWLVYCADRWLDAVHLGKRASRSLRHGLQRRWARPVLVLWCVVAIGTAGLAWLSFDATSWRASLGLLAFALTYLAIVHASRAPSSEAWRVRARLFSVAAIFTAGVTAYVWPAAPTPLTLLHLASLLTLAWMNLVATQDVEQALDRRLGTAAIPPPLRPTLRSGLLGLALAAALATFSAAPELRALSASALLAGVGIAAVVTTAHRREPESSHAWLDATLLLVAIPGWW